MNIWSRTFLSIALVIVGDSAIRSEAWQQSGNTTNDSQLFSAFSKFYRFRTATARVETGTVDEANSYYDQIAKAVNMPGGRFPERLDDLLKWAGCRSTASQLEQAAPAILNKSDLGIVSLRYFSPKTTDVSGRQLPQLLSWRKILRISVAADSQAGKSGLQAVWWLTNVYTASAADAFKNPSQNNQIIIVPRVPIVMGVGDQQRRHSILFAVYGSAVDGYLLARSTSTSWDGGTANVEKPHDPTQEYFVPQSCIQCHGGGPRNGRLNIIDTDYYIWRTRDHKDFPAMKGVSWWATDPDGFDFAAAYDLNAEILKQNEAADIESGTPNSFYTKLTSDWLRRHDRTFELATSEDRGWHGKNQELTGLLVKYCYRCHGTVAFSVLDGDRILGDIDGRRSDMLDRILADMPQDRTWEDKPDVTADLERLRVLLTTLSTENAKP